MAAGKEEKKDEKGKDKMEEKKDEKGKDKMEEKKKEDSEVITAIYKLNLHCQECGSKIKKHLMTSQGVQHVDTDMEKGEIKAKGKLDPLKILKLIEKKSKKKVELVSPKVKPKESTATTDNKPKETKEPIIRTILVKVNMHCDKCEADLKKRLMKHKGIFNVKTDMKAQNLIAEGTIEAEKLLSFMRKKVHKNAEVISIKEEKKEEKKETKEKEGKSSETKKEKEDSKSGEEKKEEKKEKGKEEGKKKDDSKPGESTKEKEGKSSETNKEKDSKYGEEKKEEKKEKGKEEGKKKDENKPGESTKEKEGKSSETNKEKEDSKSGEITKTNENVPYIIHYVYAPQLFSDENPNSCSIL